MSCLKKQQKHPLFFIISLLQPLLTGDRLAQPFLQVLRVRLKEGFTCVVLTGTSPSLALQNLFEDSIRFVTAAYRWEPSRSIQGHILVIL